MDSKNVVEAIGLLKKEYHDAKYYLNFSSALKLMVAAILSAQAMDEVVNKCTGQLFKKYRTAKDFEKLDEKDIKSVTFSGAKAKNIRTTCKVISERYGGSVPRTMEELTELPGIGRKTANTILINGFNIVVGIPCDTHVLRVSYRLGWTSNTNPERVEKDLMKLIPKGDWEKIPYLLKDHGRAVCKAPVPHCSACFLAKLCPKNGVAKSA